VQQNVQREIEFLAVNSIAENWQTVRWWRNVDRKNICL